MSKDPKMILNGRGLNTQLAHGTHNPHDFYGFLAPPVVHASTVLFADVETMLSNTAQYTYGTTGTPTTVALETILNKLEGSHGTVLVPSGLMAVSLPLLTFAKAGDHILMVDALYWPTRRFCNQLLTRMNIDIEYYDPNINSAIADLLRPNTSIVYMEGVCSNTFEVQDIPAIIDAIDAYGYGDDQRPITMVDNTWATPVYFRPLDHGIDISIHALTKYPGGHSDLVLGSVSANPSHFQTLREGFEAIGCCAGGDDCSQVIRGLRTMGIRLERHSASTIEIIHWLKDRHEVVEIYYPALSGCSGHEVWKRDYRGASGLFSFTLKNRDIAVQFLDHLQFFGLGYSWGGYESLAVLVDISNRTIPHKADEGALIRFNIGLEDPKDLIDDLEQAFSAIA